MTNEVINLTCAGGLHYKRRLITECPAAKTLSAPFPHFIRVCNIFTKACTKFWVLSETVGSMQMVKWRAFIYYIRQGMKKIGVIYKQVIQ